MAKKSNPFVEKMEEKKGKDLDGDGEKGESKGHKAKVFGKGSGKGAPPPFASKGKGKLPPNLAKGKLMGGVCTTCKKKPCVC